MNALSIADLNVSTDLDRDALAAVSGGAGYYDGGPYAVSYANGSWSGYHDGVTLATQYICGQKYKSQVRWTRTRTQYEYSYWNYYWT
jgi:hypothetical protein